MNAGIGANQSSLGAVSNITSLALQKINGR
jgi:hypothetical protein